IRKTNEFVVFWSNVPTIAVLVARRCVVVEANIQEYSFAVRVITVVVALIVSSIGSLNQTRSESTVEVEWENSTLHLKLEAVELAWTKTFTSSASVPLVL